MTDASHAAIGTTGETGDAEPLVEKLLAPFRRFAATAAAGGIVLLAATAVALVWANSPWSESYHYLWETPITLGVAGWTLRTTLQHDAPRPGSGSGRRCTFLSTIC